MLKLKRRPQRIVVGADVSPKPKLSRPKRKIPWKKVAVTGMAATALGSGIFAIKEGIIPNPLKSQSQQASQNNVGRFAKRAAEKAKQWDLLGTQRRARKIQEVALELKRNGLNPQAALMVREARLNPAEARALQEIASKTFEMNPDSLKQSHFIRVVRGLNFAGRGNVTSAEFGELVSGQIASNRLSLGNKRVRGEERQRIERLVRAEQALLGHPNGLELARKIWGHRF